MNLEALENIRLGMVRIEAKFDSWSKTQADHETRLRTIERGCGQPCANHDDHETRIRSLERWRNVHAGGLALLAGIGMYLWKLFEGRH